MTDETYRSRELQVHAFLLPQINLKPHEFEKSFTNGQFPFKLW
jgi:hypothetical protein